MKRTLLEIPIPFLDWHIPIYSYGFMLMLGFLFGLLVVRRRARAGGLDPDLMTDLCLYILLAGVLGGRLLFVIHHFRDYAGNPLEILKVFKGGLSFYGGFFAAITTAAVFCSRKGLPALKVLDMAAAGLALGMAFGRIGCFLNGCCYGDRAEEGFLFAVQFPKIKDALGNIDGSPAFLHHLEEGWVGFADPYSLPVHPTQLYSSLGDFLLFLALSALYSYKKRDGEMVLLFCIFYAPMRFIWEILRDDSTPVFYGLTLSQVISIPVFLLSLGLFLYGRWELKKKGGMLKGYK